MDEETTLKVYLLHLLQKYAKLSTRELRHQQGKMYYDIQFLLDNYTNGCTKEVLKLYIDYLLDSYELYLSTELSQEKRDHVLVYMEELGKCYM